jgi:hypothetical protein
MQYSQAYRSQCRSIFKKLQSHNFQQLVDLAVLTLMILMPLQRNQSQSDLNNPDRQVWSYGEIHVKRGLYKTDFLYPLLGKVSKVTFRKLWLQSRIAVKDFG